jgi:hypothetical protein
MMSELVSDSATDGEVGSVEMTRGQGSSKQVGNDHVSSALQVAVMIVSYPGAQTTEIPVPVGDSGTDGLIQSAEALAGQGSSSQVGKVQVSSSLHVAVDVVENPAAQVTGMPVLVTDSETDGEVGSVEMIDRQGSSKQVGNDHVSSALQVALPVVDHPVAHVTAISTPVGDSGANGVSPDAGTVAGQGSSTQVGKFHVPSILQVAVSVVE